MELSHILLPVDSWKWDSAVRIGGGGFGQVFEASGPGHERLAVKVVPKAAGATREQLIVDDIPESPHVVPVLHVSETPDSYLLFMPRADHSLRDKIGAELTAGEAIAILVDIARALAVIAPAIVHRDIKPDNVLYLNGSWALCDFGISRYAEATTSQDTQKYSMTASYAAPEQWRHERATSATDVYAFGVMAYELLAGERPFTGSVDDLRAKHLNEVPALLPGNRKLAWLVGECLGKAPESRPTPANLLDRLNRAGLEAASRGGSALAVAQSAVVTARAEEGARQQAERIERERREQLVAASEIGYNALLEEVVEFVGDGAPATTVRRESDGGVSLSLGSALLRVSALKPYGTRGASYDVISYGEIRVEAQGMSRSHSLYFANFASEANYSWFEMGFMMRFGADFGNDPRAVPPSQGLGAFGAGMGSLQLGYGIVPLDIGDLDHFVDAWAERFGNAASGRFPRLSRLPDGEVNYPARR